MTIEKTVLLGLTGLLGGAVCHADEVEELDPITVLARRIASTRDENASSVGIITSDDLARMQRHRLLESLELVPGTQVLSTAGLTGNIGTSIVRGLPSRYQQALVDGVRVSDTTNALGNFLGNGQLGQITQIEVLRGPQSVLFGSGAGGGVIGYETAVGTGEAKSSFFAEGGSFDSYRTSLSSQGSIGNFSYGAELGYQSTSNDTYTELPLHDYEQSYANLALQWQLHEDLRLKLSYRGTDNLLETKAITGFGTFDSEIETETSLVAANLFYSVTPDWESRFTAGYYFESYRGDFGTSLFGTDFGRWTLHWTNEIEISDTLTMIGGIENSTSHFKNSGGRRANETVTGAYTNLYYRPIESLLLEGGVRYDYNNTFGGDLAWNAGAVYIIASTGTRIHGRVSEAYRNPSRLDSEFFPGVFSTQLANPDLESEQILGWETGITQSLGDHELGVTYYQQELEDAIFTDFLPGGMFTSRVNNPRRSAVSGLEIAASGPIVDKRLRYRMAFTSQFSEEVIDLPDQLATIDISYDGGDWLLGAGVSYAGRAAYSVPGRPQTDTRTVTRVYGQYQVTDSLLLHARIENLFDESYQLFPNSVNGGMAVAGTGSEGAGRSLFLGATLSW